MIRFKARSEKRKFLLSQKSQKKLQAAPGDLYTESGQTLQCSFSSVSTPPIARVGAFFSIFHDLQDIHAFAPLQTQNFRKILSFFFEILQKILKILQNFGQILLDFHEISPEFHVNFELLKSRGLPGFVPGSSRVLPDVLQFSSRPMPSTVRPFS